MHISIKRLDPDLPLPAQQHPDDAGYDLHARESVVLAPGGGRALVPTGVAVAIPSGHAGLVMPRSGLALKHGVTCLNTPGLIDPLYRGELKVLLVNTDPSEPFEVDEERLTREDEITSTVHYLRFRFTPGQQAAFAAGPVRLVVDHPEYRAEVELTPDQRVELASDFLA